MRMLPLIAVSFAAMLPAQDEPPAEGEFSFAPLLSESGFYTSTAKQQIAPEFVPYVINSELWSDGAEKDRFVRVPAGQKMIFSADGPWEFPVGTTFLQTLYFDDGDERVYMETRVLVRGADDLHFASYLWNDDYDDAELVDEFGDDTYAIHGDVTQLWSVVAREDCRQCHSPVVEGRTLGIRTDQWNRVSTDGQTNQLRLFAQLGILDGVPADLSGLPVKADPRDATAALEARVRSYLDVNCSACHRPGGRGSGTLDLRPGVALEHTGLFRSRMISPGQPRRSRLLGRMIAIDKNRMPNLLSTVADVDGLRMIADWVEGLETGLRHDAENAEIDRTPQPEDGSGSK